MTRITRILRIFISLIIRHILNFRKIIICENSRNLRNLRSFTTASFFVLNVFSIPLKVSISTTFIYFLDVSADASSHFTKLQVRGRHVCFYCYNNSLLLKTFTHLSTKFCGSVFSLIATLVM